MKHLPIALLGFALASTPVLANPFSEVESNDTPATANNLGTYSGTGSILVEGSITPGDPALDLPGDVDYFSFTIDFEAYFFASAFGIPQSTANAQMVLVSGTTIIAADDDSGIGLFPSLEATLSPGTYLIALTGYNDLDLPGTPTLPDGRNANQTPHMEDFQYKLLMGFSVVPAPSAAAVLGLGALAAARRRR